MTGVLLNNYGIMPKFAWCKSKCNFGLEFAEEVGFSDPCLAMLLNDGNLVHNSLSLNEIVLLYSFVCLCLFLSVLTTS